MAAVSWRDPPDPRLVARGDEILKAINEMRQTFRPLAITLTREDARAFYESTRARLKDYMPGTFEMQERATAFGIELTWPK